MLLVASNHIDLTVWIAIFISILSVIISLWRNNYDIESDKDKRTKEMVQGAIRKIEQIEGTWDERLDKLDRVMDRISNATYALESQVAILKAQMGFILKDKGGSQ